MNKKFVFDKSVGCGFKITKEVREMGKRFGQKEKGTGRVVTLAGILATIPLNELLSKVRRNLKKKKSNQAQTITEPDAR